MALTVSIEAKARICRVFDLSQLIDASEFDPAEVDLSQQADIRQLYEYVTEFVETGEVGAYDDMLFHLHGFDPEICEIVIHDRKDRTIDPDAITLRNRPVAEIVGDMERLPAGKMVLATLSTGDARWDFAGREEVAQADPSALQLGYYDCGGEGDSYEIVANALFDYLCDTFSTDGIAYGGEALELQDFVFHEQQVYGEIFVVTQAPDSDLRMLQRLDPEESALQDRGWQLLVNRYSDV